MDVPRDAITYHVVDERSDSFRDRRSRVKSRWVLYVRVDDLSSTAAFALFGLFYVSCSSIERSDIDFVQMAHDSAKAGILFLCQLYFLDLLNARVDIHLAAAVVVEQCEVL
jgi:hypothetical protein